jgi:hypothetical protein
MVGVEKGLGMQQQAAKSKIMSMVEILVREDYITKWIKVKLKLKHCTKYVQCFGKAEEGSVFPNVATR